VPSKAIAGAKLLGTPGQKTVLGSTMLFVFALPETKRVTVGGPETQRTAEAAQRGQPVSGQAE